MTKTKAPTANMMGDSAASKNPFSRPPSSSRHAPAFELTTKPSDRKGISTLPVPAHWHYLHQAERDRPKAYQSPYAEDGGFTEAYRPKHKDSLETQPKRYSLSEDFLLKQTPGDQDKLKAHIKRNNDDRIKRQQEKIRQGQEKLHLIAQQQEQQRQQQEQELRQQRQSLSLNAPNPSPTSYHASNPLQNHHHSPFQSFNDFSTNYNRYSDLYAPNSHAHSPTTYHGSYAQAPPQQQDVQPHRVHNPWSNASPPGSAGLQYQSPQDFKMQMQREAQQQSERNEFNKFVRGLQFAAGQGPPGMSNHTPGGSGSPLKYETASAEMLPIMRDQRY